MARPYPHRASPACRHADGTISSSTVADVRRMASEDSDQVCPGPTPQPCRCSPPTRKHRPRSNLLRLQTTSPARADQPFLLIFRTVQIVTARDLNRGRVPDGYSVFPAYSRMQSTPLPAWWATNYLRTVPLVTTRAKALGRLAHFWRALMVAHECGLSHPTTALGLWARRIVSEDSAAHGDGLSC